MRDNDGIILESLYGKVILNEISSKYVDEVKDAVADKELPFNNIFGDKLRIRIPLSGTKEYSEIMGRISQIKNFDHFDPDKKEVVKKIEVDPKYGGGVKYQKINLGRAISSLNIPEEEKKKMLDWFANYSSNIPEMENMGKYTIVLSRSPIDILRMSDIGAIQSCHSQGGQYFHCAIQEAKTGGPIAYLVKTNEVDNLSEEEFQYDEIFKDSERDVKGIDAISRLRIRRYRSDENPDISIGIPETRVYGNRISGFYDTLRNFFMEKQFPENNLDELSSQFRKKEWVRTGGSYSDSSDSHLFNQMFGTDVFYGSLEHDSEDEGQSRADQFDDELRHFQNGVELVHFSASYDVDMYDDGDNVYYNAFGGLNINLSELGVEVSDDFATYAGEVTDPYEFRTLKSYNPNGKYDWEKRIPYGFKENENMARRVSKFIRDFIEFDPTRFSDDLFTGMYLGQDKKSIQLYCCFGDDCSGTSYDTDDYRSFLNDLHYYDGRYDEIAAAFVKALRKNGFASNKDFDEADVLDDTTLEEELKKFELDISDSNMYGGKTLGIVPSENKTNYDNVKANEYFNRKYPIFLQNYINTVYRPQPKESPSQLKFKGFLESFQNPKTLNEYGIRTSSSFDLQESGYGLKKEGDSYVNYMLNIYYDDVLTKELYDLLIFLDNSFDDLMNGAKYLIFSDIFKIKSQYVENLKRVYSKYFL